MTLCPDKKIPGSVLLSHPVTQAVPSTQRGLTSVFGMGTGVSLSLRPPENFLIRKFWFTVHSSRYPPPGAGTANCQLITVNQKFCNAKFFQLHRETQKTSKSFASPRNERKNLGQVARLISIARLNPLLDLHLRPINPVIYREP